ncbi:E3 ubiquitin-protein ligase TRIM71-like isoform X2 [Anneissia japonica]|nr:E3 ubiquitin-protein ligase TRIM71-like isoform X2 [Anneissia japonica]
MMKCYCDNQAQAKYVCKDCRQNLCSTCSDKHKTFPLFANHTQYLIDNVQLQSCKQAKSLHRPPVSVKPLQHRNEPLKMKQEGKHKPIGTSIALQALKELQNDAHLCQNKLQDGLNTVEQNAIRLEQSKHKSLSDIDNHVQEMVKKIHENGDNMKNRVEKIYNKKKKVNDVQIDELKTTISDISTKLSILNQLLNNNDAAEPAMQSSERVIKALKEGMNKLPKTQPHDNEQIYFLPNKKQIASLKTHWIGDISTQAREADSLTLRQGKESMTQVPRKQPTGITDGRQVQEGINGSHIVAHKTVTNKKTVIIREKEQLVSTIKIHQQFIRDIVKCEGDCLEVSCLTNEIFKYKQSGEYIGKITLPQGVKVNRMYKMKNGDIVFSNLGSPTSIKVCNKDGHVIKSIGVRSPEGIHVDEASSSVYVGSGGCIILISIDSGSMIGRIGIEGTLEGQMRRVVDIARTSKGQVLALDLEIKNSKLQLFDNGGKFMKVLVEAGYEYGKVRDSRGVVVDKDDNIIITSNHKLQLFSSDGKFIRRIDKDEDGINNPWGLSIISHHPRRVAVANDGNKTVKIFNY